MWLYFPNTKGVPLEEIAALFGDADEVAVYERELTLGLDAKLSEITEKEVPVEHVEGTV